MSDQDKVLIGCLLVGTIVIALLIYTFMVTTSPVYSG